MALDFVFLLNMLTGHLSAASDEKTIPARRAKLGCACVLCSLLCSRCESVFRVKYVHTPFSMSARPLPHTRSQRRCVDSSPGTLTLSFHAQPVSQRGWAGPRSQALCSCRTHTHTHCTPHVKILRYKNQYS